MASKGAHQNDDVLNGTEEWDELFAGVFSNVTLNGLGGGDQLYAGGGTGGEFNGGDGNDFLKAGGEFTSSETRHIGGVFNGDDGDDLFNAHYSSGGTFNGGDGNDKLSVSWADSAVLNGDAGDDTLYGEIVTRGTFIFSGGTGYDTLYIGRKFNEFAIVKEGETVLLFSANYKATITGIERFYFSARRRIHKSSRWKRSEPIPIAP